MTLEELAFLIERLAEAGCTTEQLVAAARAARDFKTERRLFLAVKRALKPGPVSDADEAINRDNVPVSPMGESPNGDSDVPVSERLGRKQTARKAILVAPGLTGRAKSVLAALIDRADAETGRCFPSRARIAADAGIAGRWPERAVSRAIEQATTDELVRRVAGGGGRGRSTLYVLDWARFALLLDQVEGRAGGPLLEAARRRTNRDIAAARNRDNRDTGAPLTHTESQPPVVRERSVARAEPEPPQRQLPLMGVVGGTDSRRQKALQQVEASVLGKYRRHEERRDMLARFSRMDADEAAIVADAEIEERGGLRAFEGLVRGPPRAAGAG